MKRLLAVAVGTALVLVPLHFFYVTTVPVPQYQTGTAADYRYAIMAALMIYGGTAFGIVGVWWLSRRRGDAIDGRRVFQAGVYGAIGTISLVMVGWAAYRWLTLGFVTASWAMAPVVAILAGACSAMVGAGAGLVWYGVHGQRATPV
jgi:hypothetical protein